MKFSLRISSKCEFESCHIYYKNPYEKAILYNAKMTERIAPANSFMFKVTNYSTSVMF